MLPLVFAARKIDGEDPQIIFYLRIAYFSVQTLIVLYTIYTYLQATLAAKGKETMVIYVPPAAQVCMFASSNLVSLLVNKSDGTHIVHGGFQILEGMGADIT